MQCVSSQKNCVEWHTVEVPAEVGGTPAGNVCAAVARGSDEALQPVHGHGGEGRREVLKPLIMRDDAGVYGGVTDGKRNGSVTLAVTAAAEAFHAPSTTPRHSASWIRPGRGCGELLHL